MIGNVAALRAEVKERQLKLQQEYERTGDACALLRGRSAGVDEVLCKLWTSLDFPATLALAAVGGYGRGELFPSSDIDLLILLPQEACPALQEKLETLIGHFWDIGLEIGHSVRTIQECLEEASNDITVQTALLEARLLTGNEKLFATFEKRLHGNLDPLLFFEAKKLEQQERYLRFNETPFSLEPNCKDSPGGQRDLQVIFWIAKAAGYGGTWHELHQSGILTHEGITLAESCEEFLRHLRIRLHLQAGRREDRLLFDYQNTLAERFGFVSTDARRASEQLMQVYYRNAKAVTLINTILLQNMGAALSPESEQVPQVLDEDFQSVGNLLDIRDEKLFERKPSAIFDSFLAMQESHELHGMTARTLRALWRASDRIGPEFRADPANQAAFIRLFTSPRGVVHEFRRMNQLDILGAYLPNFGRIVGQMQHDLFHVYTVDQHILQVMRNIRRFTMSEFAHEYPLCARVMSEFDQPWLLYIAALFHDIAKGRGGDHSELGTADARVFCEEHRLSTQDTELVVWLVRNHLVMSQVAQKEDLTDPEVISNFSRLVGDLRHLQALYLLTHADIRGTSPKVWNQWKGKLLADLFFQTQHYLEQKEAPAPHGIIAERQAEAMRLLRFFALSDTVHERLWKQLDMVYFLRHSAEEIAWHTRSLHYRIFNNQPVVRARLHQDGEGLQVMVYTQDQPDLFARIVGFFARAGYSIVDAKIHTTAHGYALDSFVVLDIEKRDNNREMVAYIEHELEHRLVHQTPPEAPSAGRLSRQVKHFPIKPEASIRGDERGTHFILSLIAADRPGLLYAVANILAEHHANLHTAKITTLGERAEDVFLISGGDLNESASRIRLETELMDQLKI
ncbi:bifunctional uridylyltransferase/uridylyl-removing protein [Dechloromonas denitrificans]|uniref:Bifunctional uridylyltransferase/uridylyl-removing enzyme n=2 Tax=Dechloromonas denitrificans TaxID=281362 RepID=A0A133XPB2_9RHOO|nr:bifunctional uridylyltransferase/uridylyl-removing protein [Dechloromonas denitrificans]